MIPRLSAFALSLLLAAPLAAQAPQGWQMRVDRSTNAADPDDVPDVTVSTMGSNFQVNTGPAVVMWNPANTATGAYTLRGRFTLQQPSGHVNYYGLVFGGRDLTGSSQNYLYFLVAQNGSFIVKHRANDETTHDVVARTRHDAIRANDGSAPSVNDLEVRVGAEQIEFVVNGTVVHTQPKQGMAGRTDGAWGVRVNHVIPGVLVENLGVTR
jgi:hypothetical protein